MPETFGSVSNAYYSKNFQAFLTTCTELDNYTEHPCKKYCGRTDDISMELHYSNIYSTVP